MCPFLLYFLRGIRRIYSQAEKNAKVRQQLNVRYMTIKALACDFEPARAAALPKHNLERVRECWYETIGWI